MMGIAVWLVFLVSILLASSHAKPIVRAVALATAFWAYSVPK